MCGAICVVVLCYFHMVKNMRENAKKASTGMNYIESVVLPCVESLHRCPDLRSFEKLSVATLKRFRSDEENAVADWFEEYYLSDRWRNWYAGCQPIAGVGFTQGPIEASNRMIKLAVICIIL
jgi:hypothetical protein